MKSTRPDDFRTEDAESWQEQFQADAETLRHRGFSSVFCGAWLAFWAYTAEHFGERLEAESERMRARLALPGESRDVILEKCRRASMALMGALVRADKHRSEFRREKIPAWQLEAAARGRSTDFVGMPDEERRRIQRNQTWELKVYPVPRALKSVARQALLSRGLPRIKEWLSAERPPVWRHGRKHCEIFFVESDGRIIVRESGAA